MTTTLRIVGFLAAVVAVFALALGVGRAAGPTVGDAEEAPAHQGRENTTDGAPQDSEQSAEYTPAVDLPGGLMVSEAGYTLRLNQSEAPPGRAVPVSFVIEGRDGQPVTAYDIEHEKRLHLIAVRRDLSGFQHVHPILSLDGVWLTSLDLRPGQWRLFADFSPAAAEEPLTLGADLAVAGTYQLDPAPGVARASRVDDYEVSLDGKLVPGTASQLTLTVIKDGKPVTDLQPYLGAYGHLVALRDGDLAYLHVHPQGTPGDGATQPGPAVVFYASVPAWGATTSS